MRAPARALTALLALTTPACSVVFGGSRYTGGADPEVDAATPVELDAFVPDAFERDAFVALGVDAPRMSDDDAGPISCDVTSDCPDGHWCDTMVDTCASCDGDRDGLLHPECVPHTDGEAWDCEPGSPVVVRDIPTAFAHTLRVFLGDAALHVFYVGDSGTRHATFPVMGTPTDAPIATPALARFDAARFAPAGVTVVGYDGVGVHRYDLRDDSLAYVGSRDWVDLAGIGYPDVVPGGPVALIEGTEGAAYVGLGATWGATSGRMVIDIGGSMPGLAFNQGSDLETFYLVPAPPASTRFASGRNVALIPNDTSPGNPFWLWAGDVRRQADNLGIDTFDVGSMMVGQLAVARVGNDIVAFAGIRGGSGVRLAANLARCTADIHDCTFAVGTAIPISVADMTQTTIAVFPTSESSLSFATTTDDAFVMGNLRCPVTGCTTLPTMPSTTRIVAPAMDSREVALDLRQVGEARVTIALARASDTQIQVTQFDVCLPPSP